MTGKSETINIAQTSAAATVQIDCNFPGGNVRIFDIDSTSGVVQPYDHNRRMLGIKNLFEKKR